MKFSVLMSLYFKEKAEYLELCLNSLYEQTVIPDDIVIVFDGPVGKCLERVIIKWQEKLPINIVRLAKNVGLGKALNIGIQHCKHNLIARMDTDDICEKYRFKIQLDRFYENNNLSLLGGYVTEFDGKTTASKKVPLDFYTIKKVALYRNPFNHMSVMFKRDIIEAVGGYKDHHFMEDYNLWIRLIAKDYICENLDISLVKARVGRDMVKRRLGLRYVSSEFLLMRHKIKYLNQPAFNALKVCFVRSIARLLPPYFVGKIYDYLRGGRTYA